MRRRPSVAETVREIVRNPLDGVEASFHQRGGHSSPFFFERIKTSRRCTFLEHAARMRKIMTPGSSAGLALAIASMAGTAHGIAQEMPKFDCAKLAPVVQRQAREMSA